MHHNQHALVTNLRVVEAAPEDPNGEEPEAAIRARLKERFDILEAMTYICIDGGTRSFICSGPPGLGKTFTIEQILDQYDTSGVAVGIAKGYAKPTGMYKLLWQYRHEGCVIMFDDCDSIFHDEVALNILKAVADTTERRRVTWLTEAKMFDEDGMQIPKNFEFNGSVIFVTNLDFDTMIRRESKIAKHLAAIMSRSHYLDMAIRNRRDYLIRIKMVVESGMLGEMEIQERADVMDYIERHHEQLREVSLRSAVKLAALRKGRAKDWQRIANITLCK